MFTAHSSMSKKDNQKNNNNNNTPSCSTTHLPVLEGRNQPALKIDMRGERSRAAAEGERAGRGGRWQLVAWISASQTGPVAIPHAPPAQCRPATSNWPALPSSGPSRPRKKGHAHPAVGQSPMLLPGGEKIAQVASVLIIQHWR